MDESPRAVRAFSDYLAMGPSRSLARLARRYRSEPTSAPTRRLTTLKVWSATYGWGTRIAERTAREQEAAEAQYLEARRAAMEEGLALDYERVRKLKRIANREAKVVMQTLAEVRDDPLGANEALTKRYAAVKSAFDRSLPALAAETGGRVKRVSVKGELTEYAITLARSQGYDEAVAIEIARIVASDGG